MRRIKTIYRRPSLEKHSIVRMCFLIKRKNETKATKKEEKIALKITNIKNDSLNRQNVNTLGRNLHARV